MLNAGEKRAQKHYRSVLSVKSLAQYWGKGFLAAGLLQHAVTASPPV